MELHLSRQPLKARPHIHIRPHPELRLRLTSGVSLISRATFQLRNTEKIIHNECKCFCAHNFIIVIIITTIHGGMRNDEESLWSSGSLASLSLYFCLPLRFGSRDVSCVCSGYEPVASQTGHQGGPGHQVGCLFSKTRHKDNNLLTQFASANATAGSEVGHRYRYRYRHGYTDAQIPSYWDTEIHRYSERRLPRQRQLTEAYPCACPGLPILNWTVRI